MSTAADLPTVAQPTAEELWNEILSTRTSELKPKQREIIASSEYTLIYARVMEMMDCIASNTKEKKLTICLKAIKPVLAHLKAFSVGISTMCQAAANPACLFRVASKCFSQYYCPLCINSCCFANICCNRLSLATPALSQRYLIHLGLSQPASPGSPGILNSCHTSRPFMHACDRSTTSTLDSVYLPSSSARRSSGVNTHSSPGTVSICFAN